MRRYLLLSFALAGLLVPAASPAQDSLPPPAQTVQLVENINARLEGAGSSLRLGEVWFFTIGRGVDPYRTLRTGLRWYKTSVSYALDESDYGATLPAPDVDAALASSYGTWNGVSNTTISTARVPDDGENNDILDAVVLDGGGNCVDIVGTTSPGPNLREPSHAVPCDRTEASPRRGHSLLERVECFCFTSEARSHRRICTGLFTSTLQMEFSPRVNNCAGSFVG